MPGQGVFWKLSPHLPAVRQHQRGDELSWRSQDRPGERPAAELVSAWGVPDRVTAASEVGFESSKLDDVEIWTYDDRARSVVVRDDIVVSIRVV